MRPEFLAEHLGATMRGLIDPLALRVAALEARAPIPGPPGPAGPAGPSGRDGIDGKAGLRYLGVHVAGKTYDVGDLVTAGGSAWYCGRTTTGDPGRSPDWQLMVKRGRDARAARDERGSER